jgi:hypothetical protein
MKIKVIVRPEAVSQPRVVQNVDKKNTSQVEFLPRCEATRVTTYNSFYEGRADVTKQCSMAARYEIDGVNLCARHAGEVALAQALEEQNDT